MLWKCTHCKYVFEHDEILALTTCEVQVRTLLQRAYAELSHDTSYKPSVTLEGDVRLQIARAPALVETTDEIFDLLPVEEIGALN